MTLLLYLCSDGLKNASVIKKCTGCKGDYPFLQLPNHNSVEQTLPDAMHTIRDSIVNIFELITGKDDTKNCRQCEAAFGRYFGMDPTDVTAKINRKNPIVSYSLFGADLELADKRCETIITPPHIDFVPKLFFSKQSGLKSHDWKQVCTYVTALYALLNELYFADSLSRYIKILFTELVRSRTKESSLQVL